MLKLQKYNFKLVGWILRLTNWFLQNSYSLGEMYTNKPKKCRFNFHALWTKNFQTRYREGKVSANVRVPLLPTNMCRVCPESMWRVIYAQPETSIARARARGWLKSRKENWETSSLKEMVRGGSISQYLTEEGEEIGILQTVRVHGACSL